MTAAMICYTTRRDWSDVTFWDDAEQAAEAVRDLTPCGPKCEGAHTVVTVLDGQYRSRPIPKEER